MQFPRPDHPGASVKVFTKPFRPGSQRQYSGENDTGGGGRSLKISNFIGSGGERLGSNIEACQPADAATDEVNQRNPIPACLQTGSKTEGSRGNAKRENVRQRIEFPPQRRMLVPPSRYASVEHIKYESACHHPGRTEEMGDRQASDIQHGEKH